MEEVLVTLAQTNVELAICEEEAESQQSLLRSLREDSARMTAMVEKLLSEKRLFTQDLILLTGHCLTEEKTRGKSLSDSGKGRDSLETQADSPRLAAFSDKFEAGANCREECRHLLLNWEKVRQSKKLRKVVRKGFTQELRGELWQKAIGNALRLTMDSLDVYSSLVGPAPGNEYTAVKLIPLDVRRTLTFLQQFQEDQPLHTPLRSLLCAFAVPLELGIAARHRIRASNLIIKSQLLYDCYTFDVARIQQYYEIVDARVKDAIPKVWRKLRELAVTPEMYLLEWLFTVFVRCVRIGEVPQLWDFLLTQGESAFFAVPVAILGRMQAAILAADVDSICKVFDIVPQLVGETSELLRLCE